jgi:hypothetical protein
MPNDIRYKYKNKLFEDNLLNHTSKFGTIIKYNNNINNIRLLSIITYFSNLLFSVSQRYEKVSNTVNKILKYNSKKR